MDLLIPRRPYYSKYYDLDTCPECGAQTREEKSVIMLAVKSDTDEGQFVTNLSGSHFCYDCPVVIFDSSQVEQAALMGIRGDRNIRYFIVGMIDLDSIPKEKKHLELGSDENPVPLIDFLPDLNTKERSPKISKKPNKIVAKLSQTKRIGRNQPCSCGSGKKYKRCCGK